jgi:regulator of replication initiation timing
MLETSWLLARAQASELPTMPLPTMTMSLSIIMSKVRKHIRVTVNLAQHLTTTLSLPSSPLSFSGGLPFTRGSYSSSSKRLGIKIPSSAYSLKRPQRTAVRTSPGSKQDVSALTDAQMVLSDKTSELSAALDQIGDLEAKVAQLKEEVVRLKTENKMLRSKQIKGRVLQRSATAPEGLRNKVAGELARKMADFKLALRQHLEQS